MRRFEAHPSVRLRLQRLADEFDLIALGRGEEFLLAVGATFERIAENPESWPVVHGPLRLHHVPDFPVAVYYEVTDDDVYILGVE